MKSYVQAVPERMPHVTRYMLPRLAEWSKPSVVLDPEHRGVLWSATQIWRAVADRGEPALVVQDDVVFNKALPAAVPHILAHIAAGRMEAVSLFTHFPTKFMMAAWEAGANYVANSDFLGLPGIILTPSFAKGLLDVGPVVGLRNHLAADRVPWKYSRAGHPVHQCIPSLVMHVVGMRSVIRRAVSPQGKLVQMKPHVQTPVWDPHVDPDHYREFLCAVYKSRSVCRATPEGA